MSYSEGESKVLARFTEKCRIAGGAKAGFNLRRESIEYGLDEEQLSATSSGLEDLVAKGLLVGNEGGDRFMLTEAGVEALNAGG